MGCGAIVAIVADTHLPRGSRALSEACVAAIGTADLLIHAGDFSGLSAYEGFAAIGPPLVAVHGNVDDRELRARLPESTVVEVGRARIGLIHDAGPARGRLARLRRRFPEADAVVFGHSHLPLLERDEAGAFQIFNPGSPTDRRRAPEHTMGLAEVAAGEVRFRHLEV
ncbi:MAG: YfcE family phosphodiesterase [Solirubrobacterales bacterium]|nr:YfcE family phosphodiesterase [Solirubrobacterales bacterium]